MDKQEQELKDVKHVLSTPQIWKSSGINVCVRYIEGYWFLNAKEPNEDVMSEDVYEGFKSLFYSINKKLEDIGVMDKQEQELKDGYYWFVSSEDVGGECDSLKKGIPIPVEVNNPCVNVLGRYTDVCVDELKGKFILIEPPDLEELKK